MAENKSRFPELAVALKNVRAYFGYAALFSAAINLLLLIPIIYMLQVYDRVLSSGSLSTLAMLTILMVCLLLAMGGFDWVRSNIMIAASNRLESMLRPRVADATFKRALLSGGRASHSQPLNDLAQLRQYMTGPGLFAFFDTPWVPIYILLMFLFHFYFGMVALISVVVMLGLTYWNERASNEKLQEANKLNGAVVASVNGNLRNAEVIAAMGMADNIDARHQARADEVMDLQSQASQRSSIIGSVSKCFRMIMQSSTLGLGALLALGQDISPGMVIAGALLLGRAMAPIDQLVASWRGFSVARAQYARLGELLEAVPADPASMSLPAPEGRLSAEQVVVVPPGATDPVVKGVTIDLLPGEALGIVGPSASGKSSLARALLGIWPVRGGSVRLDGADTSSWDRHELGPHIGYLPQDIELFAGTVAENICRFGETDAEMVVEAAEMAGVHDLILHLPQGYDTAIGEAGSILSGGQKQRIALARAVYGTPRFVVLDEPNSNLDDQGERELVEAVLRLKAANASVVVISHRTLILQTVDKMLVLRDGLQLEYGPRDEVLGKLTKASPAKLPSGS
ncbi:MAG: type I secretion system permease/ATPase [Rhodospirillaceae bacterium]|jgi:ATP-binding cassette subfamily C protein EexD|nr:type I secretion system permease/ATPase [Rhodospirillaceae bacterium]